MAPANEHPWLKTEDAPFAFRCERCGSREVFKIPSTIDKTLQRMRAFIRHHSECAEAAPAVKS